MMTTDTTATKEAKLWLVEQKKDCPQCDGVGAGCRPETLLGPSPCKSTGKVALVSEWREWSLRGWFPDISLEKLLAGMADLGFLWNGAEAPILDGTVSGELATETAWVFSPRNWHFGDGRDKIGRDKDAWVAAMMALKAREAADA